MACPDYQSMMLPILQVMSGQRELKLAELRSLAAEAMKLSEADLSERIGIRGKLAYSDRANWACTYLTKAGLLDWVRRGVYQITHAAEKCSRASP